MARPKASLGMCRQCGRPIYMGQPYETASGERSTAQGIVHKTCPPDLRIVK